jgi:hypothetical protein
MNNNSYRSPNEELIFDKRSGGYKYSMGGYLITKLFDICANVNKEDICKFVLLMYTTRSASAFTSDQRAMTFVNNVSPKVTPAFMKVLKELKMEEEFKMLYEKHPLMYFSNWCKNTFIKEGVTEIGEIYMRINFFGNLDALRGGKMNNKVLDDTVSSDEWKVSFVNTAHLAPWALRVSDKTNFVKIYFADPQMIILNHFHIWLAFMAFDLKDIFLFYYNNPTKFIASMSSRRPSEAIKVLVEYSVAAKKGAWSFQKEDKTDSEVWDFISRYMWDWKSFDSTLFAKLFLFIGCFPKVMWKDLAKAFLQDGFVFYNMDLALSKHLREAVDKMLVRLDDDEKHFKGLVKYHFF